MSDLSNKEFLRFLSYNMGLPSNSRIPLTVLHKTYEPRVKDENIPVKKENRIKRKK